MGILEFFKDFFWGFWDYETPKIMIVKNRRLGVIYRSVQLLVITYFIWYVFISQKAYQETEDRPESSVYTEMRGVAILGESVRDVTEYSKPSERTGHCVPYYNYTFKTCEIKSWCPIEEAAAEIEPPLEEAVNFTVFIRNSIHFPKFKVLRVNIKPRKPKKLLRCHYHPETNPYCPVFRLGYIADQAREKFSELCKTGGVIGAFINWNCDFDVDPSECVPTYSFRRLDLRKTLTSSGYHYRFAKYYYKNGVEYRSLINAFGIRLDVIVHGHAGKFSLIPTIINAVTAMTSVGICSIICDWIMLTFIDKNEVYSGKKFDDLQDNVKVDDAKRNKDIAVDDAEEKDDEKGGDNKEDDVEQEDDTIEDVEEEDSKEKPEEKDKEAEDKEDDAEEKDDEKEGDNKEDNAKQEDAEEEDDKEKPEAEDKAEEEDDEEEAKDKVDV
ncbi:P2X purinoceptor 2 [Bagarius yarrelli]|uniref:P2X purinoceptor n=1 Tax=Bagarius yarrelli TaxID=175774 RepID=A0A556V4G9_BAGYA|nr:P2X purinoceptor 2 [Bagarius yarrelli]